MARKTKPDRFRLFVALWPDPQVRRRLTELQATFDLQKTGRCIVARNLHITLQFIGEVSESRCEELIRIVHAVELDPFEFELDRIGFFPRSRVVWAGSAERNTNLDVLARQIRSRIRENGSSSGNTGFTPHVTLSRKAHKRIDAAIDPILWTVDRCHLVRSIQIASGVRYSTIAVSGRERADSIGQSVK